MNLDAIQTCPWVSILPPTVMQQLKEGDKVSLIKMLINVTQQAVDIYESNQFAYLDALVGNYGCETHTFNELSLAHCTELKEECKSVRETCQKVYECIETRQKTAAKKRAPLDQFCQEIENIGSVSEWMKYLIQSRLLTITKTATFDATKYDSRDYEDLKTTPGKLTKYAKMSSTIDGSLNEIISIVQSNMSLSSIIFMREKLNQLIIAQKDEGQLVNQMMSDQYLCEYTPSASTTLKKTIYPKTYSCCYYNTKALLLLLAELQAPLIIKKMTKAGDPVEHYAFKSSGEFGQFQLMTQEEIDSSPAGTPVVVCVAYLSDTLSSEEWLEKVQNYGLGNMILASASQGSQYIPNKPEVFPIPLKEAEDEVSFQLKKAEELECLFMNNSIFDLDHFYCSNWSQRGVNIGEYKS